MSESVPNISTISATFNPRQATTSNEIALEFVRLHKKVLQQLAEVFHVYIRRDLSITTESSFAEGTVHYVVEARYAVMEATEKRPKGLHKAAPRSDDDMTAGFGLTQNSSANGGAEVLAVPATLPNL